MSSSNFFIPQPGLIRTFCVSAVSLPESSCSLYASKCLSYLPLSCVSYLTDNGQYPPNSYFGNDESNLDEYDNIDCELLLEFFGSEPTGPSRQGYESNSYNRQNSIFPLSSDDNPVAAVISEQHKHTYDREGESTSRHNDLADIKKEKFSAGTSKIKKQKLSVEEAQGNTNSKQTNEERSNTVTNDGMINSLPVTSKSSTSKTIQLEASKDRRRLVRPYSTQSFKYVSLFFVSIIFSLFITQYNYSVNVTRFWHGKQDARRRQNLKLSGSNY